jgi:ABC-type nickel/cobalt efflux system permease component RcnA
MINPHLFKINSILILLGLAILAAVSLTPTSTQAHSIGSSPFFKVNGKFVDFYHVPLTSEYFEIPQSEPPDKYLVNQSINFEIDTSLINAPREITDNANYEWTFGDGTAASGKINKHTYTKPGSYIINIMAGYQDQTPQLLESSMIHVLPRADYPFARPKILVNGQKVDDPNTQTLTMKLTEDLHFELTDYPTIQTLNSIEWDFGDKVYEAKPTAIHRYDATQPLYFIAMRAIDQNGIIYDNFIELIHDGELVVASTTPTISVPPQGKSWSDQIAGLTRSITIDVVNFNANPWLFLLAVLLIFIAGALHAVTPGHGKSMLAAFLIGKHKSGLSDVMIIALSITLTHTAVIYVLGLIFLFLDKNHTISEYIPFFEKLSAMLVVILAINLIYSGWKNHQHLQSHKEGGHTHDHKLNIRSKRDLLLAGISGGILPCLDAFSLLILSVSAGKILFGIFMVFIFSLGLAAAIILIGLALVAGKNRFNLEDRFGNFAEVYAPIISGAIIFLIALKILVG